MAFELHLNFLKCHPSGLVKKKSIILQGLSAALELGRVPPGTKHIPTSGICIWCFFCRAHSSCRNTVSFVSVSIQVSFCLRCLPSTSTHSAPVTSVPLPNSLSLLYVLLLNINLYVFSVFYLFEWLSLPTKI